MKTILFPLLILNISILFSQTDSSYLKINSIGLSVNLSTSSRYLSFEKEREANVFFNTNFNNNLNYETEKYKKNSTVYIGIEVNTGLVFKKGLFSKIKDHELRIGLAFQVTGHNSDFIFNEQNIHYIDTNTNQIIRNTTGNSIDFRNTSNEFALNLVFIKNFRPNKSLKPFIGIGLNTQTSVYTKMRITESKYSYSNSPSNEHKTDFKNQYYLKGKNYTAIQAYIPIGFNLKVLTLQKGSLWLNSSLRIGANFQLKKDFIYKTPYISLPLLPVGIMELRYKFN